MRRAGLPALRFVACLVAVCCGPAAERARGLINPSLQPVDLFERYLNVVAAEVETVDAAGTGASLKVIRAYKGGPAPGARVAVSFGPEIASEAAGLMALDPSDGEYPRVVAFVGKTRRRREGDMMLYRDGFLLGQAAEPEQWVLTEGDKALTGIDGEAVPSLMGTWNGSVAQFMAMLEDVVADRCHFPRKAYARFRPDVLLDDFAPHPVRGIALHDLDGDDDLDIYACSPGGNRLYFQVEPMRFANAEGAIGHEHAGVSCSIADVDGDGRFDLLADAALFANRLIDNRFALTPQGRLPLPNGARIKSAAFVELDGDGAPDVLVSLTGGGLRAFRNPADSGFAFRDISDLVGLRGDAATREGTGFFAVGDWNDDGRSDVFYAAEPGLLMVQDGTGVFRPLDHRLPFDFVSGADREAGLTGAACFLPLYGGGPPGLIVPSESSWMVVENRAGAPVDVTKYGNEISEGSYLHLASVATDLNVDGHVDFYTVSRSPNGHNRYIINRGYGSFMLATVNKYEDQMFRGPAHQSGGWGLVAGDVNNDGADDLIIGNSAGKLSLIVNDTPAMRVPVEHPTDDIARLQKVRLLSVRVTGLTGVVGARVTVAGERGRQIGHGTIGGNVATGCCGPDTLNFAVHETGTCTVTVRYADGLERRWPVDLSRAIRTLLEAERGDEF